MSSSRTPLLFTVGIVAVTSALAMIDFDPPKPPEGTTAPKVAVTDTPPLGPVDSVAGATGGNIEPARGDFLYLFDVSSSTHTGAKEDPFLTSLRILEPGINAIRENEILMPQRHRVGTIGAASLMQRPKCDFRAESPFIFKRADTTAVTRRLVSCIEAMRQAQPEGGTDIRGALHYAGLTLRGTSRLTRGVVLVTDLEEVIPRGKIAATPQLSGLCVLVLSMMTPYFAANPDSLTRLEQSWATRIRDWGATSVNVRSVLGFHPTEIANYFETCNER